MKLKIPPPLQGLVAAVIIWVLNQFFPAMGVSLPLQKIIALLLMICGLSIDLVSVVAFFKAKTTVNPLSPHNTKHLVVSGLYCISRNPMYLGMLLILTGWVLWIGNMLGLFALLLFVVSITYLQIKPEERVLEEKFGATYTDYKERVRRWI